MIAGGRSNYQMRVHYINDKQRHVFESMMKRCLEERPTARGTFEDAMEDIQVLLRKYAKNRQTETLEGRNVRQCQCIVATKFTVFDKYKLIYMHGLSICIERHRKNEV